MGNKITTSVMEDFIRKAMTEARALRDESKCPICKGAVSEKDFKDYLFMKEFKISGMCQNCQDMTFCEPEERDYED